MPEPELTTLANGQKIVTNATGAGGQSLNDNFTSIDSHLGDTNNPHAVDAVDVGLGNVDNTADADKPISTAAQTALDAKASVGSVAELENDTGESIAYLSQLIAAKASTSALTSHEGDTANPHSVTATQVGLGNVDNTSDADKPVSTTTQTALDFKLDASSGALLSNLDADDNKIVNLLDGSSSQDAVTKSQLDAKLDLAGGTMAGNVELQTNNIQFGTPGSSSGQGIYSDSNGFFYFSSSLDPTVSGISATNVINNFNNFTALHMQRVSTGTGDFIKCLDSSSTELFTVENDGKVLANGATFDADISLSSNAINGVGSIFHTGGVWALAASTGLKLGNSSVVNWGSGGGYGSSRDLGIERESAGVLKVSNGSSGYGSLAASSITADGQFSGGQLALATFNALSNIAPASNFATVDTRNGHLLLDFDDTTDESAVFQGIMPPSYGGGGIAVDIVWAASSATSGDIVWSAEIERGTTDLNSDSFAAANTATTTTNGTSGIVTTTTISFTDGADMDSLAAGETFRLRLTRDADNGSDTMVGDAELVSVQIKES